MNLSEDGGRVAFLAAQNTIYRDGEIYRDYQARQVSFPLTLSGDGRVLAWQVRAEAGFQIGVNDVLGAVYPQSGLPVSSFDGKVIAYRASDADDSWFIVVDGKRISGSFESVTHPAVSRDGRVVAYAAEGDRKLLFVGAKRIVLAETARSVFLSRDGGAWGYVTKTAVVTAQGAGEAFDEIRDPEFSPDGKRVAFGARQGERWFVVVEGRKFAAPGIVGGPFWSEDGTQVGYGALLGRELWWKIVID